MNLVGIYAKLRRAEDQIHKLTSESEEFCKDVRQSIVREIGHNVDEQVWVYRGKTPIVPPVWLVNLGEILYNLRSALDHLVWQLVLANGEEPGRYSAFPITPDSAGWEKEHTRTPLKGISPRHEKMIEHLQPYTGGISLNFDVSMLKVLKELHDIEKHRHPIVAPVANTEVLSALFEPGGLDHLDLDGRSPLEGVRRNPALKQGIELLRFNNVAIDISPCFQIDLCFSDLGAPRPASRLSYVLAECLRTVRGSVGFLTTSMGDPFYTDYKWP